VFFHWCFLAFSWPLFFLTDIIAFRLRLVMIELSSAFLGFVGVENVRSGTAIRSPADIAAGIDQGARFALDIADPCSGIRSLFALLMVAALWGHLRLPKAWQVCAIVLCAVPLAILGNFVRVVLLVGASIALGPEFAVGAPDDPSAFHFAAGIAVFVVALGGLVLAGRAMGRAAPLSARAPEAARMAGT
jgi:exosortase